MAPNNIFRTLCAFPLLLSGALSHMQMEEPSPLRDPHSNRTDEPKDFNILTPLHADGSDFTCKGYQWNTPLTSVATYEPGGTYQMKLRGGATHSGGSCQISMSCDNGQHFKVLKSIEGGCLTDSMEYDFTIPQYAEDAQCLLAWTWFNKVGNREMYMNCAVVDIASARGYSGGSSNSGSRSWDLRRSSDDSSSAAQAALTNLPDLFVANLAGINDCKTQETDDIVFDDPGRDVVYGDGVTSSSSSGGFTGGNGQCTGVGRESAGRSSSSSSSSSSSGGSSDGSSGSPSGGSSWSPSGGSSSGNDGQWHGDDSSKGSSDSSGSSGAVNCNDGQWHPNACGDAPKSNPAPTDSGSSSHDSSDDSSDEDSNQSMSHDDSGSTTGRVMGNELTDIPDDSGAYSDDTDSSYSDDDTWYEDDDDGSYDYDYSGSFDPDFQRQQLEPRQVKGPTAIPGAVPIPPEEDPDIDPNFEVISDGTSSYMAVKDGLTTIYAPVPTPDGPPIYGHDGEMLVDTPLGDWDADSFYVPGPEVPLPPALAPPALAPPAPTEPIVSAPSISIAVPTGLYPLNFSSPVVPSSPSSLLFDIPTAISSVPIATVSDIVGPEPTVEDALDDLGAADSPLPPIDPAFPPGLPFRDVLEALDDDLDIDPSLGRLENSKFKSDQLNARANPASACAESVPYATGNPNDYALPCQPDSLLCKSSTEFWTCSHSGDSGWAYGGLRGVARGMVCKPNLVTSQTKTGQTPQGQVPAREGVTGAQGGDSITAILERLDRVIGKFASLQNGVAKERVDNEKSQWTRLELVKRVGRWASRDEERVGEATENPLDTISNKLDTLTGKIDDLSSYYGGHKAKRIPRWWSSPSEDDSGAEDPLASIFGKLDSSIEKAKELLQTVTNSANQARSRITIKRCTNAQSQTDPSVDPLAATFDKLDRLSIIADAILKTLNKTNMKGSLKRRQLGDFSGKSDSTAAGQGVVDRIRGAMGAALSNMKQPSEKAQDNYVDSGIPGFQYSRGGAGDGVDAESVDPATFFDEDAVIEPDDSFKYSRGGAGDGADADSVDPAKFFDEDAVIEPDDGVSSRVPGFGYGRNNPGDGVDVGDVDPATFFDDDAVITTDDDAIRRQWEDTYGENSLDEFSNFPEKLRKRQVPDPTAAVTNGTGAGAEQAAKPKNVPEFHFSNGTGGGDGVDEDTTADVTALFGAEPPKYQELWGPSDAADAAPPPDVAAPEASTPEAPTDPAALSVAKSMKAKSAKAKSAKAKSAKVKSAKVKSAGTGAPAPMDPPMAGMADSSGPSGPSGANAQAMTNPAAAGLADSAAPPAANAQALSQPAAMSGPKAGSQRAYNADSAPPSGQAVGKAGSLSMGRPGVAMDPADPVPDTPLALGKAKAKAKANFDSASADDFDAPEPPLVKGKGKFKGKGKKGKGKGKGNLSPDVQPSDLLDVLVPSITAVPLVMPSAGNVNPNALAASLAAEAAPRITSQSTTTVYMVPSPATINGTATLVNVTTEPFLVTAATPTPDKATEWEDGILANLFPEGISSASIPVPTPTATGLAANILPLFMGPGPVVPPSLTISWPGPSNFRDLPATPPVVVPAIPTESSTLLIAAVNNPDLPPVPSVLPLASVPWPPPIPGVVSSEWPPALPGVTPLPSVAAILPPMPPAVTPVLPVLPAAAADLPAAAPPVPAAAPDILPGLPPVQKPKARRSINKVEKMRRAMAQKEAKEIALKKLRREEACGFVSTDYYRNDLYVKSS